MKKFILASMAAFALSGSVAATSVSKVEPAQTGYTQAVGSSSGYSTFPGSNQQQVHRYLYSAFQRGYQEGNLQVNMAGARFQAVPWMNISNLVMDQAGFSRLDVYFQKRSDYRVERARMGVLARQMDYRRGSLEIRVNGTVVESWYTPSEQNRFEERLVEVGTMLRDGLNHVQISLKDSQGAVGLLGVKVETWERKSGYSDDNSNLSDRQFVDSVFQRYFNRYPTTHESRRYVRMLRFKSRTEVEQLIRSENGGGSSSGDEYEQLVDEYFQRYANRLPTVSERDMYSRRLRNGQLSLPDFRRILENLNSGGSNDPVLESRVRNQFFQTLNRYPTNEELSYYVRQINSGTMTWEQFVREVRMLGGGGAGLGFSYQEIQAMDFRTVVINSGWLTRLEATDDYVLRTLLRKAQSAVLYSSGLMARRNAETVVERIRMIRPGLLY